MSAIKSLQKNKFFTSVSLFGIAFTLMLLVIVAALFETNLGKMSPLSNRDKLVVSSRAMLLNYRTDTLTTYDTSFENGLTVIDSQTRYDRIRTSGWFENPNYFLLDRYYRNVSDVETFTFFHDQNVHDVFVNDQKVTLSSNYTDGSYWDVFDFDFIEGRAYQEQEINASSAVAVITDRTSNALFGKSAGVLGSTFVINGRSITVIGVVKSVNTFASLVNSDLYFPITLLPSNLLQSQNYLGSFSAVFMAEKSSDRVKIMDELNRITSGIPLPSDEDYDELQVINGGFEEVIAGGIMSSDEPKKSWMRLRLLTSFLVLLFILVPTINLINLNLSQILGRVDEIGVRKAFGATRSMIVYQLLFENLVLTIIGGLLGFVAAVGIMELINGSGAMPFTLRFNGTVFGYGLVLILLFSIISGVIPALRTSKIHIIEALNNNQV